MNNATWWTPTGWNTAPEPEAYASATKEDEDYRDWLKTAGYEYCTSYGEEYSSMEIKIYSYPRNDSRPLEHFLIELCDGDAYARFFVEEKHYAVFFATWYVQFRRDTATSLILESLKRIDKTLTAFVRYGTGERTINADADWSFGRGVAQFITGQL